jgi:glycosyltransferase involved in cell wall biosynthesis
VIIINGRFFSRRATGVDRFAYEIVAAIDHLIEVEDESVKGLSFKIMLPPAVSTERQFKHIPMETVGRHNGQLWEQWDLPRAVPDGALLLNLCNTGPLLTRRQILVIHDAGTVSTPGSYSLRFRLWYRILLPLLGLIARKILTVSEFSKNEIVSSFNIPSDKVSVIIEGGEHISRTAPKATTVKDFGLTQRPYVLAVSSMAAHKNFQLVLDAVSRIENPSFDIAIAGGTNSRIFGDSGIAISNQLKWLGYVSDAELRALYESALCFVFPSVYEGFGIPPLEAMQCGCPVLASRSASIPEVCGNAALYFDAQNPDELAKLLMQVSSDTKLRADLKQKGVVQAAQFSWKKAALQVVAAIHEL